MKTIEEFLQSNPISYDFTDDCTDSAAYQEKKSYEKYFIYRSPEPAITFPAVTQAIERNSRLYGAPKDPDTCSQLLQEIYSLLWPDIRECKKEYMMSGGWICSDTMTSCQAVLNHFVRSKMPEAPGRYGAKYVSNDMCIDLYETDPLFREMLEESEDLAHFVRAYHTLGNYIPVPYGFNCARSGHFASHDSWDLTLMKIKEFYDIGGGGQSNSEKLFTGPESKIMELLHCNREIFCCCQWLNSFAGWEDFIDKNYLQDFVDAAYQPFPFSKGHAWESPWVRGDFDHFFRNAWQCIEKRSERMIREIEKIIP